MSGNSLVADTNILIYLLSNDKVLSEILDQKQVYISFVTELELLSFRKFTAEEKKTILQLISECIIIDINSEIKKLVIDFRGKYNIKLPDAIIAATSSYINLPLITADKHFKELAEIDILLYQREDIKP